MKDMEKILRKFNIDEICRYEFIEICYKIKANNKKIVKKIIINMN